MGSKTETPGSSETETTGSAGTPRRPQKGAAVGSGLLIRRATVLVPVVVGFLWMPSAAAAHALLASSQPGSGQKLGTAPGVVLLEFTEPINGTLSRAVVIDPAGAPFAGHGTGGPEIRVALTTNVPGVYTVRWSAVSTVDGHTERGSFQFGVGVSPLGSRAPTAATSPGRADLALAVLRWVEYVSLLVALGVLVLRRLSRGRPELRWVRARPVPPLVIALVAAEAVIGWEVVSATGTVSASSLWTYLTTGLAGPARLSRFGLEALALLAAVLGAGVVWVLVVAAMGALAASGHAAAIHPTWWGVMVDAVHLLAAGVWAGGIVALALERPPGGWRSSAGRELLVRFSPPALAAFTVTVGFGAIQAVQELGTARALLGSSYGEVLMVKAGLVGAMVPLSVAAWRLRRPHLRSEATLAVVAAAAAAVLAAFPVPPSRLALGEAAQRATPSVLARPRPGELTLGGHAGAVLVGLTLAPGRPGLNQMLVYLLPTEGAAGRVRATLSIGRMKLALGSCGGTCRRTSAELSGHEIATVHVAGPGGGDATFRIPTLPAPDGSAIMTRAERRMLRLHTYRIDETLSSGAAVVPVRYAFEAPDRLISTSGSGAQIIIGTTRYLRENRRGVWRRQPGGPPLSVPSFIWEYFKPFVDVRVVGRGRVEGVRTTIVSFADRQPGTPIWFRLWIDPRGLVRRGEMRAPGHFMNDIYHDFDAPFTIEAPTVVAPPSGGPPTIGT